MKNYERVFNQQKATYHKSRFVIKQVELFITENELVFESSKTSIRGLGLLNSVLRLNFEKKNNEVIIPFNSIESVKASSDGLSDNVFNVIDKNGKNYRFEMKQSDEWVELINDKMELLNN
jgi:hypothetical protein